MKPILCLLVFVASALASVAQTIGPVPARLGLSSFYCKYVDCRGIPIVSSWRVPDSCLVQAYRIIDGMTRQLKPEVMKALVDKGTRVGVMARYEGTTDLPEHTYLKSDTVINWDLRARGLEGTLELPLTTCAEENILAYQIDPYHAEDILIHEFAHSIQMIGIKTVDPTIDAQLQTLLDEAVGEGKYAGTYAKENFMEYWAEGVQDWFDANAEQPLPDGKHNWVNTRDDLRLYDPRLHDLIAKYFSPERETVSLHPYQNLYTKDDPRAYRRLHRVKKTGIAIPEVAVGPVPADLRARLHLSPRYSKYINANGMHILASWKAPDSALVAAYRTVYAMTSMLPREVLEAMQRIDTRVVVMGRYEGTYEVPEHASLASDTTLNWNLRARGLGGTLDEPITSCAEENVLGYQIDKYHAEDILIHEFSHSIHLIGILQTDPTINTQLQSLLRQALAEGKYQGTYAGSNFEEYWAEGVQDWFNVNGEVARPDGKHNHVNTREELRRYDPRLYALIAKYFPKTKAQISCHRKVNMF